MNLTYEATLALAERYGDDFFIFDKQKFISNFKSLDQSFKKYYPKFRIGYSYKTNYTPQICKLVDDLGGIAEVVSEMELELAQRIGVASENIIYNGPSKSSASLIEALENRCIVNLDSKRDLDILIDLAVRKPDQSFSCVLRCNFPLDNGHISRFGFDVDSREFLEAIERIKNSDNILLDGLHCHFPNRDLESYSKRINKMLELVDIHFDSTPKFLNVGGGFFSSMPENMWERFGGKPPIFEDYAEVIGGALSRRYPGGDGPTLFIEPGTALVADTFEYYCKVISVKEVRGKNIATVQGSIFTISPTARNQELPVTLISGQPEEPEAFDIAGFTCIEGDYLSKGVEFKIRAGDFIKYSNVGSYSVVMKPPFILPAPPVLSFNQDEFMIIKERESNSNVFERFFHE